MTDFINFIFVIANSRRAAEVRRRQPLMVLVRDCRYFGQKLPVISRNFFQKDRRISFAQKVFLFFVYFFLFAFKKKKMDRGKGRGAPVSILPKG